MSVGKSEQHSGQLIPETLTSAVQELGAAYDKCSKDPEFIAEPNDLYKNCTGHPSLLYYTEKMTEDLGGARTYLRREDLNYTGSHKINNALGWVLLAREVGKTRVTAEADAGRHDVTTATAAALLGMECEVLMGKEDTDRQASNVFRIQLLDAKVYPVTGGTQTLKDAVNETMREWANRVEDTHHVPGSVMDSHPSPTIVRDFQGTIGREIRGQLLKTEGKLPSMVTTHVGGGSNTIGAFYESTNEPSMALVGCKATGEGVETEQYAATICKDSLGILHGMKSYLCQDEYRQIAPTYSISAGSDYPGIGPKHASSHDTSRASYVPVTDSGAADAFQYLLRMEGIILAIESAHAVSYARKVAPGTSRDDIIVINLSGRGDKDTVAIARYVGVNIYG